jgi:uncharacterized LabA/DUF88 family protein
VAPERDAGRGLVHPTDDSADEVALVFRQQEDGRKVSRLPGGKVVLLDLDAIDQVDDGHRWLVRLDHRETFAIAYPLDRLPDPPPATDDQVVDVIRTADVRPVSTDAPSPASLTRPGDRVALFINGAAMDGAARDTGYYLDYARVRSYFEGEGTLVAGVYHTPATPEADPARVRFLDFLSHNGFTVRRKPVRTFSDPETGRVRTKCDLDIDVAVDMLTKADHYDVAFLFTGDGDLERVVEVLRARGKRIFVVSSRAAMARDLAYAADKPVFWLEEHEAALRRVDRAPEDGQTDSL